MNITVINPGFYQEIIRKYRSISHQRRKFPTLFHLIYHFSPGTVINPILRNQVYHFHRQVYLKFNLFFHKHDTHSTSLHYQQPIGKKDSISSPPLVKPGNTDPIKPIISNLRHREPKRIIPGTGPGIQVSTILQNQTAGTIKPGSSRNSQAAPGIEPRTVDAHPEHPGAMKTLASPGFPGTSDKVEDVIIPPGRLLPGISHIRTPGVMNLLEPGKPGFNVDKPGGKESPAPSVEFAPGVSLRTHDTSKVIVNKVYGKSLQKHLIEEFLPGGAGSPALVIPGEMNLVESTKPGLHIKEPGSKEFPAGPVEFPLLTLKTGASGDRWSSPQASRENIGFLPTRTTGIPGLMWYPAKRAVLRQKDPFSPDFSIAAKRKMSTFLKNPDEDEVTGDFRHPGPVSLPSLTYFRPIKTHAPEREPSRLADDDIKKTAFTRDRINGIQGENISRTYGSPAVSRQQDIDLNQLTDQVYRLLERKIKIEKEMRGW
jgi:hypothetical protein